MELKSKSGKEIIGKIPRLIFGGVKSFVGKNPIGNPGGVNVPPLKPFPIEQELENIFYESWNRIKLKIKTFRNKVL